MRMIDADALKLSHCKECTLYPDKCLGDDCDWGSIAHINMMPTVEAEPVKHGHWIMEFENDDGRSLRCSNCLMVFWVGHGRDGNYCPNCGSKMDERKEE